MGITLYKPGRDRGMKNCPKCGNEDLEIHSNRQAGKSEIYCEDCDFLFQKNIPEDRLIKLWNKLGVIKFGGC